MGRISAYGGLAGPDTGPMVCRASRFATPAKLRLQSAGGQSMLTLHFFESVPSAPVDLNFLHEQFA